MLLNRLIQPRRLRTQEVAVRLLPVESFRLFLLMVHECNYRVSVLRDDFRKKEFDYICNLGFRRVGTRLGALRLQTGDPEISGN